MEKGRDPDDPGVGSSRPTGIKTLVKKVPYQMAKGRRMEHQVFS
jgi:hypothetical protein